MKVKARGMQVNVEIAGRKGAPVVMMSHSLGCNSSMWQPQIDALARDYRVVCYDTRGHGDSDAPAGSFTLDDLGDDAAALMDALDVERVHWVGLSMGGMIGQAVALRHRDRLASLSLCDTMAQVAPEAQGIWQERIDTARARGMEPLALPTMERWFTAGFRSGSADTVERIRQQFLKTPPAGYIGCCEAIRRLDYLGSLGRISTSTLVVVGADDPATPVSAAEAIHQRIAGSRLEVIPSAAHLSNLEQPAAFNAAVLGFLRQR
jgi:3-oxoadipate enol-lactonase